jgi:hypothetical protein
MIVAFVGSLYPQPTDSYKFLPWLFLIYALRMVLAQGIATADGARGKARRLVEWLKGRIGDMSTGGRVDRSAG